MCEHVETEEEKGRKEGGELQREGSTERSKEELEGGGQNVRKVQLHTAHRFLNPEVSTQMGSN